MRWSFPRVIVGVAACGLLAWPGIAPPADPVAADALWAWAVEESGGDLAHPAFVDASEALAQLRPWHPGYAEARRRIAAVEAARSARSARPPR